MSQCNNIEIRPVDFSDRKAVRSFIKFPWIIYRQYPNWVPPLLFEQFGFFNRSKNPYFLHSDAQLFMAFRDGKPVGRISAHENNIHTSTYNDATGFFGFFESIDDEEVSGRLFDTASNWLIARGLKVMRGPVSFSLTTDETGLLVDSFDSPPVVRMTYNPPYYVKLMTSYGFKCVQDLYAYTIFEGELPDIVTSISDFAMEDPDLVVRNFDFKHFDRDAAFVRKIYEEAWSENWGATPVTDEEYDHMAKALKLIVDRDLLYIAEYKGEPAGISMVFPDLNRAVIKIKNGRLFPFGALKLVWYRRKIDTLRVAIMGVLKKFRGMGIDVVFYRKTAEVAAGKGYVSGELSWIRGSDEPLNSMLRKLGARISKTYRVYDREITPAP